MFQKVLKYIILALLVVNLPTVALNNFGATLGSLLSYSSFLLIVLYYILYLVGERPNYWMLYIGIIYFTISGLQIYLSISSSAWIISFAKYSVLIIFGNSFLKHVSKKEMIFFLLIGAISVIVNGFIIPSEYGRASGFYYNANPAGLACLFGFTLTYSLTHKRLRQLLQLIFTVGGFVTFSRTFIIVWILINLFSIKKSRKNLKVFVISISAFISIFILGEVLNLGGKRFDTFKSALTDEKPKRNLDEDSRTGTWASFYEPLVKSPILGNGYGSFKGYGINRVGVHNTYLLILGEAGIIPFLMFITFALYLLKTGWRHFKDDETLLYMSITLILYLMTLHDFFEYYVMLTLVLFWYNQTVLATQNTQNLLVDNAKVISSLRQSKALK